MAHRKKKTSNGALTLICVLLMAVLLALIAWVLLRGPECSGGVCPEVPTDPPVITTQAPTTEPSTTEPPTTVPPTTEPPATEAPTTEPPTQPDPTTMRVVTPVDLLAAPRDGAKVLENLSLGEQVEVLSLEDDWYAVSPEGYVPAHALRKPGDFLIVIDPGHQKKGNSQKEPIGPGASEKKAKVASGTQGVSTGIPEYKLTLEVSLKLRDALQDKGYRVEMIRTDHDVNISNAQRAQMANDRYADVFIRVHANGDSNPKTNGIMTLCQTKTNPYNAHLYDQSSRLSDLVLDAMVAATGAKRQFVWETDTMSGINWCQVPVTIVEMGYMSNPEEDRLMATEAYQQKLVDGMVHGIEAYLQTLE